MKSRKYFSKDEETFLIKNYPTEGALFCSKELKRPILSIQNKVHNMELKIKDLGKRFRTLREKATCDYKIRADMLINPTTPEACYILGFLWADGFLTPRFDIVTNIQEEDGAVLLPIFEKLGQWRNYIYSSKVKTWKARYTIAATCRPLAQFLETMDYKSKDSSPCKILSIIPENLKPYWFRGYFDGDGCFYTSQYQIALSGPFSQNWKFIKNLLMSLGVTFTEKQTQKINKKSKNLNSFSSIRILGRHQCFKFLKYLYDTNLQGDDLFLSRKRNKYLACFPDHAIPKRPIKF